MTSGDDDAGRSGVRRLSHAPPAPHPRLPTPRGDHARPPFPFPPPPLQVQRPASLLLHLVRRVRHRSDRHARANCPQGRSRSVLPAPFPHSPSIPPLRSKVQACGSPS